MNNQNLVGVKNSNRDIKISGHKDMVILGGGIAGLTTSIFLARVREGV
jgi:hypothetical protein